MNVLSLFSNIGVAEALLKEINMNVVVANEINERRAKLYKEIYPETEMITGDIRNNSIKEELILKSKKNNVDIVFATPPCQGMSTAGRLIENDERNYLILDIIDIIKAVKPKYVFIENVPGFLKTNLIINEQKLSIEYIINTELENEYNILNKNLNTLNFGVPQSRERNISLLSRVDVDIKWCHPDPFDKIITMEDAIGDLPSLDPFIKDLNEEEFNSLFPEFEEKKKAGLKISKWHFPPTHVYRQVYCMQYTPTGFSAFDNIDKFKPRKINGDIVKGYKNTYKRQHWNRPAYTITMDNRKISSQNNVHPGRILPDKHAVLPMYSDARCLSLFEIMRISTLPDDWNIPDNVSVPFLRSIIGEGIPPRFVNEIFKMIRG